MANKRIFYIADMHFGDKCTYRWDVRNDPRAEVFPSVEVKDQAMIDRWNARVTDHDHVYMIGDTFSCSKERAQEILKQLNGAKHLVRGNHDKAWLQEIADSRKFAVLGCRDYERVIDDGRRVILSHYPIAFWDDQHGGSYHIYGHLHASREDDEFRRFGNCLVSSRFLPEFRAYNAGAMLNGYEPKTLDELIDKYMIGSMARHEFQEKNHELGKWWREVVGDKNPNAVIPQE